jgi:membrane-bound serine protease (ClpP class)
VVLFGVGVVLLLLELMFFHSAGFLGVVGFALMVGSLVWAMADLWPNEPLHTAWSADAFVRPLANLGAGAALAVVVAAILVRFLPSGWFLDRLEIGATVGGSAQTGGSAPGSGPSLDALVGRRGVVATALRPVGQVEIGGRLYEAKIAFGDARAGAPVVVRGRMDFGLIVEKADA